MRPRNRRRWAGKDCRKAEIITKWTGSSSKITEERFTAEKKVHSFTSSLWISLKILQAKQLLQYELLHFRRIRFVRTSKLKLLESEISLITNEWTGRNSFGNLELQLFRSSQTEAPPPLQRLLNWMRELKAPKLREGMKTFRPRGPNFWGWRSWQEKAGALVEKWQLFALREFHFPCSCCRNGRRKEADRRSR
jgi:hypothetical protein